MKDISCLQFIGGHLGRDKTCEKICSRFYWGKGMPKEIERYIATCDVCQRINGVFKKCSTGLQPIPVPPKVWNQVKMLGL